MHEMKTLPQICREVGAEQETITKKAYKQKANENTTQPPLQVHFSIMAQDPS